MKLRIQTEIQNYTQPLKKDRSVAFYSKDNYSLSISKKYETTAEHLYSLVLDSDNYIFTGSFNLCYRVLREINKSDSNSKNAVVDVYETDDSVFINDELISLEVGVAKIEVGQIWDRLGYKYEIIKITMDQDNDYFVELRSSSLSDRQESVKKFLIDYTKVTS